MHKSSPLLKICKNIIFIERWQWLVVIVKAAVWTNSGRRYCASKQQKKIKSEQNMINLNMCNRVLHLCTVVHITVSGSRAEKIYNCCAVS